MPTSAFRFPARREEPKAPVFVDGEYHTTLSGPQLTSDFIAMVNAYVDKKYSSPKQAEASGRKG